MARCIGVKSISKLSTKPCKMLLAMPCASSEEKAPNRQKRFQAFFIRIDSWRLRHDVTLATKRTHVKLTTFCFFVFEAAFRAELNAFAKIQSGFNDISNTSGKAMLITGFSALPARTWTRILEREDFFSFKRRCLLRFS